jgi:hypothetical protein
MPAKRLLLARDAQSNLLGETKTHLSSKAVRRMASRLKAAGFEIDWEHSSVLNWRFHLASA